MHTRCALVDRAVPQGGALCVLYTQLRNPRQPTELRPTFICALTVSLQTAVAGLGGAPTYDYNISDFRVDMRVEAVAGPASAPVPSEGWVNFTAGPVRTTLVNGWISSRNSVTGDRYDK